MSFDIFFESCSPYGYEQMIFMTMIPIFAMSYAARIKMKVKVFSFAIFIYQILIYLALCGGANVFSICLMVFFNVCMIVTGYFINIKVNEFYKNNF